LIIEKGMSRFPNHASSIILHQYEVAMTSEKYLNRSDAPFGAEVWEKIDTAVVEAARSQLSGRRLLHTMGPHGLGFKTLPFGDAPVNGKTVEGVTVESSCAIPLAMIHSEFALPARDIAADEQSGVPLSLEPAVKAALAVARQEERLIFYGLQTLGTTGLLNTPGSRAIKLKAWDGGGPPCRTSSVP
jgi:uncharacterized linocin/CFP29 family protein